MTVLGDECCFQRSRVILITVCAGIVGAALNFCPFAIGYGPGHHFSSLAVVLTAALFGPLPGVLSACIVALASIILCGQPFSAVLLCLEALAVAWLLRGRFATPFNADIIFWAVCGIPLAYLFNTIVLHEEPSHAATLALLQGLGGVVNAVLATFCLLIIRVWMYHSGGAASCMLSARMVIYSLCVLIPLMSGGFFVALDLQRNTQLMERQAASRCIGGAESSALLIDQYLRHCSETLQQAISHGAQAPDGFKSMQTPLTEFKALAVYDRLDRKVFGHQRSGKELLPQPLSKEADLPAALRTAGDTAKHRIYTAASDSGALTLQMSVPYYRHGVYQGRIIGVIDSAGIGQMLTALQGPFKRQIVLLDEGRRVLSSSGQEPVLQTVFEQPTGKFLGGVYRVTMPKQGIHEDLDSWERVVLRAEKPLVYRPGWRMAVSYSYVPLVREFEQQLHRRVLLLFGLLGVSLAMAELLSRLFTLPLRQFEQLSSGLSHLGDDAAAAPAISGYGLKELQHVADLFGAQSARIKALFLHQQELNQELEKDVANRTAQLHLLGDNLPKGVMFKAQKNIDGKRQFVFLSKGFERIFGLSPELALADFNQVLQLLHPDDQVRLMEDIERTGDTQLPLDGIYRARRLDGSKIWIRLVCATRTQHDGNVIWEGVMLDDSERARDEELLQESCKKAEELVQAKSRFLATMSHEIRTPLSAMMGTLELFEGTQLSTEQRTYLHDFRFASEGLLQIINDLLDYSKIEAGKLTLAAAPFALEPLVRQMAVMFRPIAERKGLQLIEQFDNAAAVDYLLGDQYRLRQIMANLLSNAIKFTTHGQVQLAVQTAAAERSGTIALLITVRDSGIGIPADKQAAIFNQFEQVDSDLTRSQVGTGLGLSICARLAELMQSTITVESEPDQGSCFSLRLILEQAQAPKASTVLRKRAQQHGQRLLLVDDDEMNRMVVQVLLEREGHAVLVAEDGVHALQLLKTHQVDMVLSDISMPGMNGLELLRIIRAGDTCVPADIPVVALTGYASHDDRAVLLASGFSGCSAKPFSLKELQATITDLCGRTELTEADS